MATNKQGAHAAAWIRALKGLELVKQQPGCKRALTTRGTSSRRSSTTRRMGACRLVTFVDVLEALATAAAFDHMSTAFDH